MPPLLYRCEVVYFLFLPHIYAEGSDYSVCYSGTALPRNTEGAKVTQ